MKEKEKGKVNNIKELADASNLKPAYIIEQLERYGISKYTYYALCRNEQHPTGVEINDIYSALGWIVEIRDK